MAKAKSKRQRPRSRAEPKRSLLPPPPPAGSVAATRLEVFQETLRAVLNEKPDLTLQSEEVRAIAGRVHVPYLAAAFVDNENTDEPYVCPADIKEWLSWRQQHAGEGQ